MDEYLLHRLPHKFQWRVAISTILLTCAGVSISTVSNVARTGVTPVHVSALCILITVVQFIHLTLIDVCIQEKKDSKVQTCQTSCVLPTDNRHIKPSSNNASLSISIQLVPYHFCNKYSRHLIYRCRHIE